MLLQRKHSGNGIKEPKQWKGSIIFRAELRMWCWSTSPTHQKPWLCEAVRSTPADVKISQCSAKAQPAVGGIFLSRISQSTSGRQRFQVRSVILSKPPATTAKQRLGLKHTSTPDSKQQISSCFQAKKIVFEFGEIVVINETNWEKKWWIFVPVSTSSWDFHEADWLPGWESCTFCWLTGEAQAVWSELASYLLVGAVGSSSLTHFRTLTRCWSTCSK